MSRSCAIIAVLAAATAGCSVPYNAPLPPEQTDACSSTSDCAAGAACTGGVCVATEVSLTGLQIEVIPASNAAYGASTSFLFPLAGKVPLSLGAQNTVPFATGFNVTLPSPIAIQGGQFLVNPAMPVEPGCPLLDGALPGTPIFYPTPPFSGPPAASVTGMPAKASDGSSAFDVNLVAPEDYDIYFTPSVVKGCNGGQPIPPVFIPKSPITTSGAPTWTLPAVTSFTATITGFVDTTNPPGSVWMADLVDPSRGLSVSSQVPLGCAAGVCSATMQLAYDPTALLPILRLTPPSTNASGTSEPNTSEPTIYWSLVVTPLDAGAGAFFSAAGLLVQPLTVSGKVMDTATMTGVAATLSIQSMSLSGTVQQNASLRIDGAPTGADGSFVVSLPTGEYQIRAFPLDPTLAVTTHTITVASDLISPSCKCNLSPSCTCEPVALPLDLPIPLGGTITTPLGDPVANAQVGFSSSQVTGMSYWTTTHALSAVDTQSAKVTTDDAGNFELMVDPGSANLTVTPDPSSGFPWLVLPDLTVQTAPPPLSLAIQSPAVLQGVVRDPSGNLVAAAVVNAWVPILDASGVPTGTGVQIATTSTGADGSYTLLLPPSL